MVCEKCFKWACITQSCDLTLTPYKEHCWNRALMENMVLIMMLFPVNICMMSMCGFCHHLYVRKLVVVAAAVVAEVTAVCVFSVVVMSFLCSWCVSVLAENFCEYHGASIAPSCSDICLFCSVFFFNLFKLFQTCLTHTDALWTE